VTLDAWLRTHPYLQSVSSLHAQIEKAISELSIVTAPIPNWENYNGDFLNGAELGSNRPRTGGENDKTAAQKIGLKFVPGNIAEEVRVLDVELGDEINPLRRVADWLLNNNASTFECSGLLRYLGWTMTARYYSPSLMLFALGEMKSGGSGAIAPCADSRLPWLNLSVSIKGANAFCPAAAAARAGVTREPDALSVKTTTIGTLRL
jgi:hypothetical protein